VYSACNDLLDDASRGVGREFLGGVPMFGSRSGMVVVQLFGPKDF